MPYMVCDYGEGVVSADAGTTRSYLFGIRFSIDASDM
jgi:hypothetical protein